MWEYLAKVTGFKPTLTHVKVGKLACPLLQLYFAVTQCQKALFYFSARLIIAHPRYWNNSAFSSWFDLKNTFLSIRFFIHFSIRQHIAWLSHLFISCEVRHGSFNQVNSQPHSARPLQWLLNCQEPAKAFCAEVHYTH